MTGTPRRSPASARDGILRPVRNVAVPRSMDPGSIRRIGGTDSAASAASRRRWTSPRSATHPRCTRVTRGRSAPAPRTSGGWRRGWTRIRARSAGSAWTLPRRESNDRSTTRITRGGASRRTGGASTIAGSGRTGRSRRAARTSDLQPHVFRDATVTCRVSRVRLTLFRFVRPRAMSGLARVAPRLSEPNRTATLRLVTS
jgi:hypothetical protein